MNTLVITDKRVVEPIMVLARKHMFENITLQAILKAESTNTIYVNNYPMVIVTYREKYTIKLGHDVTYYRVNSIRYNGHQIHFKYRINEDEVGIEFQYAEISGDNPDEFLISLLMLVS